MNFFMSKNGESLRDLFVSHQDKEEITIVDDDWATIVGRFETELHERVKTPWLAEWVSPGFSTSSPDDYLTAVVLMMGLMSTFFEYSADEICGLPSITLLGTKADWERLLAKTDRLTDFGKELSQYKSRLRPILTRLVDTFEDPYHPETKAFWDQFVHAKIKHDNQCGKPPLEYSITSWIMGLFYWNSRGEPDRKFLGLYAQPGVVVLDGIRYGQCFLEDLPVGYCEVDLKSPKREGQAEEDRQHNWLIAGSIGKRIARDAPPGYLEATAPSRRVSESTDTSDGSLGKHGDTKNEVYGVLKLFRNMNCFCHTTGSDQAEPSIPARAVERMKPGHLNEKAPAAEATGNKGHCTIQPCAGWALIGPQPKTKTEHHIDEAETWGPTVHAIESCETIERYGNAVPKHLTPAGRAELTAKAAKEAKAGRERKGSRGGEMIQESGFCPILSRFLGRERLALAHVDGCVHCYFTASSRIQMASASDLLG